jgi:hypothetical protein
VIGAFADGNVSVRTEAGIGAATGELFGCATEELGGGDTGFFSAAAFSESGFADGASGFGADGFGAGEISRREGCSASFGGAAAGAEEAEADDEESGRRLRIFGSAMTATMTRSTAAAGTT